MSSNPGAESPKVVQRGSQARLSQLQDRRLALSFLPFWSKIRRRASGDRLFTPHALLGLLMDP
jgi:hypothetical protein